MTDSPARPPLPLRLVKMLVARYGRPGALLLAVVGLLFLGSVAYALEAERPWGKTVQKRVARGQELGVREYRIIGLWWASVAGAGISAVLLGTAPWWAGRRFRAEPPSPPRAGAAAGVAVAPRWLWAGLLVVTAYGAWERFPRLDHSLWNDEEYSLRSYSHGDWVPQKDGTAVFKPLRWEETLFDNAHGNNHLLTAAASRLSLAVWRGVTGAPREAFSETALRLPSFVAGLVTIAVVGWLGLQMGGPAVGLAAAALLALAPWHIRYCGESKGYAVMMALMVVNFAAAWLAVQRGGLRWWLVFALSEAGYLLAFAGSLYVAVAVNALLALDLLLRGEPRRLGEVAAFNLLAAVPVLWWMGPSVPQLLHYLTDENSPRLAMGWPWLRDLLAGWSIGWGYANPLPELHAGTGLEAQLAARGWVWKGFMAGVLPLLAGAGLVAALRRPLTRHLAVTAAGAAGVISYTHNALGETPMWVWYLVYTVVPVVMAVPLGVAWLTRARPALGAGLLALVTVGYGWAVWPTTELMRRHERQPIRETVALVRRLAPQALTATFGVSDRQARSYDPTVRVPRQPGELEEIIREARTAGRPLYVYLCGESVTGPRHPEMFARVKSGEFAPVQHLPGTEEMFGYHVYRLK